MRTCLRTTVHRLKPLLDLSCFILKMDLNSQVQESEILSGRESDYNKSFFFDLEHKIEKVSLNFKMSAYQYQSIGSLLIPLNKIRLIDRKEWFTLKNENEENSLMVLMSFSEVRNRRDPNHSVILNYSNQSYLLRKASLMNETHHYKKISQIAFNIKTLSHPDLVIQSQTINFELDDTYDMQESSTQKENNQPVIIEATCRRKERILSVLNGEDLIDKVIGRNRFGNTLEGTTCDPFNKIKLELEKIKLQKELFIEEKKTFFLLNSYMKISDGLSRECHVISSSNENKKTKKFGNFATGITGTKNSNKKTNISKNERGKKSLDLNKANRSIKSLHNHTCSKSTWGTIRKSKNDFLPTLKKENYSTINKCHTLKEKTLTFSVPFVNKRDSISVKPLANGIPCFSRKKKEADTEVNLSHSTNSKICSKSKLDFSVSKKFISNVVN